jgi:hypothetical protein
VNNLGPLVYPKRLRRRVQNAHKLFTSKASSGGAKRAVLDWKLYLWTEERSGSGKYMNMFNISLVCFGLMRMF